jgi:NAD(P)-dependent dehydrogenase (short-subunit alcohol dehydrogenase family)
MPDELPEVAQLFSLSGQVVAITGGTGALGSAMARAVAAAGARVAVLGRRADACEVLASSIRAAGGAAQGISCDVLDVASLSAARDRIAAELGPLDALVNAAGGNAPDATATPERGFFDLDPSALRAVFDVNLTGTINACQVFGRGMAERGHGSIVNIASMAGIRPLTRVIAYSAAKAALANFTQWLALTLAQEHGDGLRVNAIAPGFFLTEQNRYLLTDRETGRPTPRAAAILAHTPMGRMGNPEDLVGTLLWLLGPASAFVTGIVVPVDGGFSAFSGV